MPSTGSFAHFIFRIHFPLPAGGQRGGQAYPVSRIGTSGRPVPDWRWRWGSHNTGRLLFHRFCARARALGNAFVAVADDASTVYWNPAGMVQLDSPALQLMDRITTLDTNYVNLAGVLPLHEIGTLGLNVIFYSVNDIPVFDELGVAGGELTDKEGSLSLSYAYGIQNLSFGVNVKGLYQRMDAGKNTNGLAESRTRGMGLDLALLYRISEKLRVGVTLHDEIELKDTENAEAYTATIPRSITSGVFYQIPLGEKYRWRLMADFEQRRSLPLTLHIGSELVLYQTLSVRAGLNDIFVESRNAGRRIDLGDLFRANLKPTLGIGIARTFGNTLLKLDYAASFEKIGVRNFVSIGISP